MPQFTAQVVAAIRALLAGTNRWTGPNTFEDITVEHCEGCGGGSSPAGNNGDIQLKQGAGFAALAPQTDKVVGVVDGQFAMVTPFANARWIDLGVIDVTDLLAGRQTLYETVAGEKIVGIGFGEVVPTDDMGSNVIVFETALQQVSSLYGGLSASIASEGCPTWGNSPMPGGASDGPLTATLTSTGTGPFSPRVLETPGWQADHEYPDYQSQAPGMADIIEAGHLWYQSGASGTSGSVKPDFAGNIGGSVADGDDIVWTDNGPAPSSGSFRLYVTVANPTVA